MTPRAESQKHLSRSIWNTLFDLLKSNGLKMKMADAKPGRIAECFVPCIFMRLKEGHQLSFWERHFGVGNKSNNFVMLGRLKALPKIMKFAYQGEFPDVTNPYDWIFQETEDEFIIKVQELNEVRYIEQLMSQFVENARIKYDITFRFQLV